MHPFDAVSDEPRMVTAEPWRGISKAAWPRHRRLVVQGSRISFGNDRAHKALGVAAGEFCEFLLCARAMRGHWRWGRVLWVASNGTT